MHFPVSGYFISTKIIAVLYHYETRVRQLFHFFFILILPIHHHKLSYHLTSFSIHSKSLCGHVEWEPLFMARE
jgi:hypothetical protein